ncbi:MAG TPA: hypothetical protein VMU89_15920 [Thermomicrobiaceae bacterium]|nr:hypothetical protein [Thermomicrobiaceae bacterium]
MTHVTILQPTSNAVFTPAQSLHVAGNATGQGGAEPMLVDTVTVSVDGGPPVAASRTTVPHQHVPTVTFSVNVQAPVAAGPHTIRVDATDDGGHKAAASVTVIVAAPPGSGLTPRDSLRVAGVNPPPPSAGDWAAAIVKANQSPAGILPSLLDLAIWHERGDDYPACAREWVQVLAPGEDYDLDTVGLSGWVLRPELSQRDVPFSHPFGADWECMVALDPEFTGLLAAGNVVLDGDDGQQAQQEALTLHIPIPDEGLLAVETDGGCVPSALKDFSDTVRIGDRIAVFGRWIVDAGHHVDLPGGTSYRSEVHPPLLMAIGGTRSTPTGELTRIVVTSRPYLARQVYTTDIGNINHDAAPDDGTLLAHLNNEMDKLTRSDIWHAGLPDSTSIEVHPKIAAKPFDGVRLFRLSVRPPSALSHPGVQPAERVEVSFRFTCRSGVGVQVLGLDDHADVIVALNSVGYQAPPLPPRQPDTWTKDRLDALDPDSARLVSFEQIASILTLFTSPFGAIDLANAEHALAHGVETETYTVPDVNALDRAHAVPFVPVDQIPGGQGIVIDDSQPYPVFGFLEIRRIRPDVVVGS